LRTHAAPTGRKFIPPRVSPKCSVRRMAMNSLYSRSLGWMWH
jgi:hypothetical protein